MSAELLAPGTVFARDFRIVRKLASGGMGLVYVAEQLSTARERALKVMLGEIAKSEDFRRRFEQEAKIGPCGLDHVGILGRRDRRRHRWLGGGQTRGRVRAARGDGHPRRALHEPQLHPRDDL